MAQAQASLPSRFRDARLSSINWIAGRNDYGEYHSVNTDKIEGGGQWLLDYFNSADDKGYIYDQEGNYKYKHNKNWVNRYMKSKTDRQLEAMALGIRIPATEGEASTTTSPNVTTQSYSNEGAKKGHEENVEMHKEKMESDRQTREKNDELIQKVDDLIFVVKGVGDIISRNTSINQDLYQSLNSADLSTAVKALSDRKEEK